MSGSNIPLAGFDGQSGTRVFDGNPGLAAWDGYVSYGATVGTALWNWDLSSGVPMVSGYANNSPTKTGLLPNDLQQFCGVPLQYYAPAGQTASPVPTAQLIEWIREAEDWVEQETNLLLTPTWIASPPALSPAQAQVTKSPQYEGNGQQLGLDYDLADAAYDFFYPRATGEGWMVQSLRYRPLRNVTQSATDLTAVKNISMIYPLLNDFFLVPPSWIVEDQDFGLVRLVPAQNVAMLPLFAMQLAITGFADSVPGALWFQYQAGLTAVDYGSRFRFIKQLVLCQAATQALMSIQGTINMGFMRHETLVDGMQFKAQYSEAGPFGSLINRFEKRRDELLKTALSKVSGPMMIVI